MKDSPEARERILQALREGNAYSQAASAGGVSRWTLIAWRKADKEFDEDCHVAEGEGIKVIEDSMLRKARSDADPASFAAAKFILERRKPTRDDYAPQNPNVPFGQFQLNVLAHAAPPLMQLEARSQRPAIEGEVIREGLEAKHG